MVPFSKASCFTIIVLGLSQVVCYADDLRSLAKENVEVLLEMRKIEGELNFETDFLLQSEITRLKERDCNQNTIGDNLLDYVVCFEKNTTSPRLKRVVQGVRPTFERFAFLNQLVNNLSDNERSAFEAYVCEDSRMEDFCAKRKASVINPVVKAFVNLQQAYTVETSSLGDWTQSGFTPLQSSYFSFEEISIYDENSIISVEGIKITSLVNLAGCPVKSTWTVQCRKENEWNVRCDCLINSTDIVACEKITPSYKTVCQN